MEQKAQEQLEGALYHQEEYYKLALKLSKIVHDQCKDVPHDIGLTLADIVFNRSQSETPLLDELESGPWPDFCDFMGKKLKGE